MLSAALGKLFALSEAYPDLKANQNFLALQEELTSTENKIGFARTHYNRTTAGYNTALQTVYLEHNNITDIAPLAEALKTNTALQNLDLGNNQIADIGPLAEVLMTNTAVQAV